MGNEITLSRGSGAAARSIVLSAVGRRLCAADIVAHNKAVNVANVRDDVAVEVYDKTIIFYV